ncbi:MAG TPA: pirin-like C-terminal cupin domain-containing protein, partial [Verrucomicrobiales bacterium]|nr:pirin-like C-terminal cupin domain-containing protein [Verrucomicrobiales bacterium]
KIGAGDVQWMTAGSGIVHEEFHSREFTRQGGTLQMAQLWINLRAKDKSAPPGYQTLLEAHIPSVALPDDAGSVRIIAGEYEGRKGPARTFTPINLWDVTLRAGKPVMLPVPAGHTTALLIMSGLVAVHGGKTAKEGDLAIFARDGEGISLTATTDARLLLMDGEPIDEPVAAYGPFVMNSRAEIQQAFEDYQLGKLGELD